jgi:hypothetical protein
MTSFQMYGGPPSSLTPPSKPSDPGDGFISSLSSSNDPKRQIKYAVNKHPHKEALAAIDKALYAYYTNGIPGHNDLIINIPGHDLLSDDILEREENWVTPGIYDGKTAPQIQQCCTMFPSQHAWNGESKTFENYIFHVNG